MGVESLLLHNVGVVSAVLKVGAVDRCRLCSPKVVVTASLEDQDAFGVASWSGIWRRSKRWMHMLQRFELSHVIMFTF